MDQYRVSLQSLSTTPASGCSCCGLNTRSEEEEEKTEREQEGAKSPIKSIDESYRYICYEMEYWRG